MQQSRFFQWGLGLGSAGVLLLLGVIISGIAAPNPLFSVLTLSGIVLCGTGVLLFGISWLRDTDPGAPQPGLHAALLLLLGAALILLPDLLPGDEMPPASKKPSSRKWERGFYRFY